MSHYATEVCKCPLFQHLTLTEHAPEYVAHILTFSCHSRIVWRLYSAYKIRERVESERTYHVFYAGIVVSVRRWTDMLRFSNVNNWLYYYYILISERIYSDFCILKRTFYRNQKPLNGYAPFFMAFCGVFSWNERIYSVFQALFKAILAIIVGGLSRSEWVGMLRFRHIIMAFSIWCKGSYSPAA